MTTFLWLALIAVLYLATATRCHQLQQQIKSARAEAELARLQLRNGYQPRLAVRHQSTI